MDQTTLPNVSEVNTKENHLAHDEALNIQSRRRRRRARVSKVEMAEHYRTLTKLGENVETILSENAASQRSKRKTVEPPTIASTTPSTPPPPPLSQRKAPRRAAAQTKSSYDGDQEADEEEQKEQKRKITSLEATIVDLKSTLQLNCEENYAKLESREKCEKELQDAKREIEEVKCHANERIVTEFQRLETFHKTHVAELSNRFNDEMLKKDAEHMEMEYKYATCELEKIQLENRINQLNGVIMADQEEKKAKQSEIPPPVTSINPIATTVTNNPSLETHDLAVKEWKRKYTKLRVIGALKQLNNNRERLALKKLMEIESNLEHELNRYKTLVAQQKELIEKSHASGQAREDFLVQYNALLNVKKNLEKEHNILIQNYATVKSSNEMWSRNSTCYASAINQLALWVTRQDGNSSATVGKILQFSNGKYNFMSILERVCFMMSIPNFKTCLENVKSQCNEIELCDANAFLSKFYPTLLPMDTFVLCSLLMVANIFFPFT